MCIKKFGTFVAILLSYHFVLISENETTYEALKEVNSLHPNNPFKKLVYKFFYKKF